MIYLQHVYVALEAAETIHQTHPAQHAEDLDGIPSAVPRAVVAPNNALVAMAQAGTEHLGNRRANPLDRLHALVKVAAYLAGSLLCGPPPRQQLLAGVHALAADASIDINLHQLVAIGFATGQ